MLSLCCLLTMHAPKLCVVSCSLAALGAAVMLRLSPVTTSKCPAQSADDSAATALLIIYARCVPAALSAELINFDGPKDLSLCMQSALVFPATIYLRSLKRVKQMSIKKDIGEKGKHKDKPHLKPGACCVSCNLRQMSGVCRFSYELIGTFTQVAAAVLRHCFCALPCTT